jgi:hypothetical protein
MAIRGLSILDGETGPKQQHPHYGSSCDASDSDTEIPSTPDIMAC